METHQIILSHVKMGSTESQLWKISPSLLHEWRMEHVYPPVEVEVEDDHSDELEFKNPNEDVCEEGNPSVVAYCKGLLCLKYNNGTHVLWNPSTNSYKLLNFYGLEPLPCPLSRHTSRHTKGCVLSTVSVACGLGFVHETQDYKFVKLLRRYYDDDNASQNCHGESEIVELYSFTKNAWKEIPYDTTSHISNISGCGTYVNGLCYWDGSGGIISFDFAREEFSILPYPDPRMKGYLYDGYHVCLMVLEDSLCAVVYPETNPETNSGPGTEKHFKFWVLKEDEAGSDWSRIAEYDILVDAYAPLGFCRDFSYLLLQGMNGTLLVYNYIARKLTVVEEICGYLSSMSIFPYVKSRVQFSPLEPEACIEKSGLKEREIGLEKRKSRRGTLTRKKRDEEKKKKKKKKEAH